MSTPLNQCTECQKTLNIPFITNYCQDCFGKVEKGFRGKRLMAYHETNEQGPDGQIGWNEEKKAWITLFDGKQRIIYSPKDEEQEEPNDNQDNKCSLCRSEFTKQGNEYIWWVEEGKEDGTRFCKDCKDKKEQEQGSGHRSSMKPTTSSDPNLRTMDICLFCWQDLNAKNPPQQPHEYKDGKFTVKHDCQGKCKGYIGCFGLHSECEKSNTYKWTQENINLLWDKNFQRGMCPDCRVNSLSWDANTGDEEAKKTLAEVKKLIGKGTSTPPPQVLTKMKSWSISRSMGLSLSN